MFLLEQKLPFGSRSTIIPSFTKIGQYDILIEARPDVSLIPTIQV
jgi:hypothetical protein